MLDRLVVLVRRAVDARDPVPVIRLPVHELAPLIRGYRKEEGQYDAAAVVVRARDVQVSVIVAAPPRGADRTIEAVAELGARAFLSYLTAEADRLSLDFWRQRASESAAELAEAMATASAINDASHELAGAIAAARKLRPRDRFSGLGSIIASAGPFLAWVVGLAEDGEWRIAAAAGVLAPAIALKRESALVDCHARQTTITRVAQAGRPAVYAEDRLFARFPAYLCLPFDDGAIALAAVTRPDRTMVTRLEAMAGRLSPLIRAWMLEAEVARLRALVRKLALRMYGAVEGERARIARDLHDHQAQLLAAARIGLEAGPEAARAIFKQVEEALRLRVRELRPVTLGRSGLAEALRYEIGGLAKAGVSGRLMHADQMSGLTRPVQQLCYQVAREALANVVRHARATRVTVGVTRLGGRVRLSICDNGQGLAGAPAAGGIGLKGLRERIELMGGKLKVESRPGATRLVADLAELA